MTHISIPIPTSLPLPLPLPVYTYPCPYLTPDLFFFSYHSQFVVKFITDVQEFAKFGDEVEEEVEEPTDFHLIGDLEDVTEAMLKDPNRLSMYTSGKIFMFYI